MYNFHRYLDKLERVVQNTDRIKELLEEDGTLCYAAYVGCNPVVETLSIQKSVGKKKIYPIVNLKLVQREDQLFKDEMFTNDIHVCL